jgi:hypothetical protein
VVTPVSTRNLAARGASSITKIATALLGKPGLRVVNTVIHSLITMVIIKFVFHIFYRVTAYLGFPPNLIVHSLVDWCEDIAVIVLALIVHWKEFQRLKNHWD